MLIAVKNQQTQRKFTIQRYNRLWCMVFVTLFFSSHLGSEVFAQEQSDNSTQATGKIGKGTKTLQRKTCQVPFTGKGLSEGDLAEIIDNDGERVALVRLERYKKPNGRLVATVLVGEEKCSQLRGLNVRPAGGLTQPGIATAIGSEKPSLVQVAPNFSVTQTSMPGLALNKFLSPGYTQRGFAIQVDGNYPRTPMKIGPLDVSFNSDFKWASLSTSPALDIVKDGQVAGMQSVSTQNTRLRAGARVHLFNSRIWSGAGLTLLDSFQTSSSLSSTGTTEGADKLFKVVRDLKGNSFGVYAEQGFLINNAATFSICGGLGFISSVKTPLIEDADATNTSEDVKVEGVPLYLAGKINVPFFKLAFAEVNLDLKRLSMTIPLINENVSKAQYDVMTFSAGVGIRF